MKYKVLPRINTPDDIKGLTSAGLKRLALETRMFLIGAIAKTGGHLASNLGVVELTIALHYVFNSPHDQIVWDVGHQSYAHKLYTGRRENFSTMRQFDGLSGFPKRGESEHDAFDTGHSSTSISAALGLALGNERMGKTDFSIAVIGDGSLTGGLAYEGLNNAGRTNAKLLVILNDNQMSISENVGALSKSLNSLRTDPKYIFTKRNVKRLLKRFPKVGRPVSFALERAKTGLKSLLVPGFLFERFGFKYVGPVDGHDLDELINVLSNIKNMDAPVFLHVYTQKGKGYSHAESDPCAFHGVGRFDVTTGEPLDTPKFGFSEAFGRAMTEINNENVVAITASMTDGVGLTDFARLYPQRLYDVGIAEGHAVTFAAALAASGLTPVFAVYSSFLQRSYDQILHDACLTNKHVIFAIDRAGITGNDGETHQGAFDIAFLSHMPNMQILAPRNGLELEQMLKLAIKSDGPIAIRYPKAAAVDSTGIALAPIEWGKWEIAKTGSRIALVSVGAMFPYVNAVYNELIKRGHKPLFINTRFIKPLTDEQLAVLAECQTVFTFEDGAILGGFGMALSQKLINSQKRVINYGLPDRFIQQGTRAELMALLELDSESLTRRVLKELDS